MKMLLSGKIARVTRSIHDFRLGIARAFALEGPNVIVHSRASSILQVRL